LVANIDGAKIIDFMDSFEELTKLFLNKSQPNDNQLLHVINLVDTP
jgi:hypothetical protein